MNWATLCTRALALIITVLLASCTSVAVSKVDGKLYNIRHICIKENARVQVDDFISVIEDRFMDHGISAEVFFGRQPSRCQYIVTYTARRSWDFTPYLSYAKIKIRNDRQIIGSATYRHKGGTMILALNKWAGTKSKIDPIIDELLAEF